MRRTEKEWWLRRSRGRLALFGGGYRHGNEGGVWRPRRDASSRGLASTETRFHSLEQHLCPQKRDQATAHRDTRTQSTHPLFAGLRAHVYLAAGYGTCEQIAAATVAYPRRAPPRLPRINTISLSSPHSTLVVLSGSLSPRARSWRAALPERRRTPSHRSAENVVVSRGTAARD